MDPETAMRRATQISDPDKLEGFLRDVFMAEASLSPVTATTLARATARRIKRMVVWDQADTTPAERLAPRPLPSAAAEPAHVVAADPHRVPHPPKAEVTRAAAPPSPSASGPSRSDIPPAPQPPFDPYGFNAVVVLTRAGKDGLMKKLGAIDKPEHLRKLAEAQHLAVDKSITAAAELRLAIVKAAEQRIANRRAAAS